jgi:uracil phosphoribosyltransferase
MCAGNKP